MAHNLKLGALVRNAELDAISTYIGNAGLLRIYDGTQPSTGGTATWFRIVKSDGTTHVLDGSVGTSGADLNLNTVSIVAGGPIQVTSCTITAGNA